MQNSQGGMSRAELTSRMQLSFPSVSALVDELLEKGILQETGELQAGSRGRPRSLLQINTRCFTLPVFIMEREGYQFVLYDACGGVLEKDFLPFPALPPESSDAWCPDIGVFSRPITNCLGRLPNYEFQDIILVLPGNVGMQGIFHSTSIQIASPPAFLPSMEAEIGCRLHTINYADAMAYEEALYTKLPQDYIYLYLSKGVSASIIRDGSVPAADPWRIGEIGHMSIDYHGRPCNCGRRGCLEQYLGIDAIVADAQTILGDEITDFSSLCRLYQNGNVTVQSLIAQKATILSVAINNILSLYPIRHIVLGGKTAELGEGLLQCLHQSALTRLPGQYLSSTVFLLSKNKSGTGSLGAFYNFCNNELNIETLSREVNHENRCK